MLFRQHIGLASFAKDYFKYLWGDGKKLKKENSKFIITLLKYCRTNDELKCPTDIYEVDTDIYEVDTDIYEVDLEYKGCLTNNNRIYYNDPDMSLNNNKNNKKHDKH